jgi:hypothetical protein
VEANLNSKVSSSFAGRNPLEAFVSAPFPSSFLLAGPDGSRFVLVYFRFGGAAKDLEYLLHPIHVGQGVV